LVVKSRGSFHMEDFEIHSPGEKAIEKSEMAGGRDKERDEPKRRHRRKRALGSPADVEALLNEEESSAVSPEFRHDDDSEGEKAEAQVQSDAGAVAEREPALNGDVHAHGVSVNDDVASGGDSAAAGSLPAEPPATPPILDADKV
jgi:hypothetical protein